MGGVVPFWDRLADFGASVAIVDGADRVVTYRELAARTTEWSARLGPTPRLVVVGTRNDDDLVACYLGALAGHHAVLLTAPDMATAIADAYDADVVVTGGRMGAAIHERRPGSAHALHPDLALLLSTSGSTGSAKLVRLSHGNVAANASAIAAYLALSPHDRAQTTLPLHYCYGLSVLHSHLAVGASVVLNDASVVDPCFWDRLRRTGATNFAGVPFTFELLDRIGFPEMDLPGLRFVTQAGGRLDPAVVRRYAELGAARGFELFVMYGQTEATARMAYLPPDLARRAPASIGRPIPGGEFEIAQPDDDGVGELVYRGPNVMLGYAQCPADLALGRTVEELHTGDRARRTAEGLYEIVGRTARFVKIVGLRVDLDRIERLLADAGLSAVCTGDDEQLVIAAEPGTDPADVMGVVRATVDLPARAVRVVVIDEVPRLSSGKIDYAAIRAHAVTSAADGATTRAAGTRGDAAERVRELYAEVLDVSVVGDDDTFVDLGGDSLCYVEVSTALEQEFGPLPEGWHVKPVHEFASALSCRTAAPTRPSLPTDVLLRALATVAVLGTHVRLFHLQGGAHLLLAISGLNFARFIVDGRGNPLARLGPTLRRIAVPTMACIAALLVVNPAAFGVWKLLLVHNYTDGGRWRYWYIETLLMLCAGMALLVSVPAVRRLEQTRPFALAMAVVVIGLGVRALVATGVVAGAVEQPHNVLWLFAAGWAAVRARTNGERLLVTAAVAVGLVGFFPGDVTRSVLVLAGVITLIWTVRLPMTRVAHAPLSAIAAASLFVYLVQFEVYPPLLRVFPPLVVVPLTLVIGIAVARGVEWIGSRRGRRSRASNGAVREHATTVA